MPNPEDQLKKEELIAPEGMIRVVRSSLFPGPDVFVGDYADQDLARAVIKKSNDDLEYGAYFELRGYNDKGERVGWPAPITEEKASGESVVGEICLEVISWGKGKQFRCEEMDLAFSRLAALPFEGGELEVFYIGSEEPFKCPIEKFVSEDKFWKDQIYFKDPNGQLGRRLDDHIFTSLFADDFVPGDRLTLRAGILTEGRELILKALLWFYPGVLSDKYGIKVT